MKEYLAILRGQVLEDHEEALRKLKEHELLVEFLDQTLPEIEGALAEEQRTQTSSSSTTSGTIGLRVWRVEFG